MWLLRSLDIFGSPARLMKWIDLSWEKSKNKVWINPRADELYTASTSSAPVMLNSSQLCGVTVLCVWIIPETSVLCCVYLYTLAWPPPFLFPPRRSWFVIPFKWRMAIVFNQMVTMSQGDISCQPPPSWFTLLLSFPIIALPPFLIFHSSPNSFYIAPSLMLLHPLTNSATRFSIAVLLFLFLPHFLPVPLLPPARPSSLPPSYIIFLPHLLLNQSVPPLEE